MLFLDRKLSGTGRISWRLAVVFICAANLLAFGCRKRGIDEVQFTVPANLRIAAGQATEISVSVKHPPGDLSFLWISSDGNCDPRQTDKPYTVFFAPTQPTHVVLTATLLAAGKTNWVGALPLTIVASNSATERTTTGPVKSEHQIRITSSGLPYDENGGDATKTHIAGEVTGPNPERFWVVLYVLTDDWYVQPLGVAPYTDVDSDGNWSAWIHSGTQYAALLVAKDDRSFAPLAKVAIQAFAVRCRSAVDHDIKDGVKTDQRVGVN